MFVELYPMIHERALTSYPVLRVGMRGMNRVVAPRKSALKGKRLLQIRIKYKLQFNVVGMY
jgi:hypothetical protein